MYRLLLPVWFAGDSFAAILLQSAFFGIGQDNRLADEDAQFPVVAKSFIGTVNENLGIHEPNRSALIFPRINEPEGHIYRTI